MHFCAQELDALIYCLSLIPQVGHGALVHGAAVLRSSWSGRCVERTQQQEHEGQACPCGHQESKLNQKQKDLS